MKEQSSLVTNVIIMSPPLYPRYFPVLGIILCILNFYLVSHLQWFTTEYTNLPLNIMRSLYYIQSIQHLFLLIFLQCILNKALRKHSQSTAISSIFLQVYLHFSICLLEYVGGLQLYRFQVHSGPPKWIHPKSSKCLTIRLCLGFHPYTSRGNGITCLRFSTNIQRHWKIFIVGAGSRK